MEKEKTIFPKEKFVIGEPYQRKDIDEKIGEQVMGTFKFNKNKKWRLLSLTTRNCIFWVVDWCSR